MPFPIRPLRPAHPPQGPNAAEPTSLDVMPGHTGPQDSYEARQSSTGLSLQYGHQARRLFPATQRTRIALQGHDDMARTAVPILSQTVQAASTSASLRTWQYLYDFADDVFACLQAFQAILTRACSKLWRYIIGTNAHEPARYVGTPPQPECQTAQAVLTLTSLKIWQDAADITEGERTERIMLAERILAAVALGGKEDALSERLEIRGHLWCHRLQQLTQLPKGLKVGGSLDCSQCPNLTQLPEGLSVGGDLDCSQCPNLTQLPQGLSVGGNLYCSHCPNLTQLPQGLSVGGNLYCDHCSSLTQLPEGLSVGGNLDCSHCPSLIQLPQGLSVGGNLYCYRCSSLTQLPEGLSVGGDFNCSHCPSLIQLPQGLSVGGNFNCSRCPSLIQLPQGLSVGGDFNCSRCPSLIQLPQGLSVGGNLYCSHCSSMTQLAEGLSVGGNLYCDYCTSLTSLPNSIASWGPRTNGNTRRIELSGTGITPALQQRLQQAEMPGIQFYFSMAPSAPADVRFADLNTAASFWSEQAQGRTTPDLAAWTDVLVRDRDFLRQFLGRLCHTADYQQPDARLRLAGRVCDLLQAMDESPALRRLGSDCISDALQTCNDRVIWAMNQIEVAVRIHQAQHTEKDGAKLKELVLSFMRLDIVQAHARQKVTTLTWVDEIEVFLAYESGLREALKLPVSAEHMLFARCAQVTQADLDKARDAADAAMREPDQVAAYLQTSAPWQHHLRQQEAKQWSWERMAPKPWPQGLQAEGLQCAITLEDFASLAEPVLAPSGSTWRAYEAEALLTHWIEHGTDAFDQKLKLAELRRLA
jgi:hypothetical protein